MAQKLCLVFETEVERSVREMLQTYHLTYVHARTQRVLAALDAFMDCGVPEEEAIQKVASKYGISESAARGFLDHVKEHPDPSEW